MRRRNGTLRKARAYGRKGYFVLNGFEERLSNPFAPLHSGPVEGGLSKGAIEKTFGNPFILRQAQYERICGPFMRFDRLRKPAYRKRCEKDMFILSLSERVERSFFSPFFCPEQAGDPLSNPFALLHSGPVEGGLSKGAINKTFGNPVLLRQAQHERICGPFMCFDKLSTNGFAGRSCASTGSARTDLRAVHAFRQAQHERICGPFMCFDKLSTNGFAAIHALRQPQRERICGPFMCFDRLGTNGFAAIHALRQARHERICRPRGYSRKVS
jgi:hypothetical protein